MASTVVELHCCKSHRTAITLIGYLLAKDANAELTMPLDVWGHKRYGSHDVSLKPPLNIVFIGNGYVIIDYVMTVFQRDLDDKGDGV